MSNRDIASRTSDRILGKTVIIEKASSEDIPGITAIENVSFPSTWDESTYIKELTHKIAIFLVAKLEGKVVGFALSWYPANELHILKIAVDESYRKQGIATKLMKHTFDYAKNAGFHFAFLEARRSNIAAQNFYRKLGFSILLVKKNYYTDTNEDAFIMASNIGDE